MSASSSWAILARRISVTHRRRVVAVDRAEVALAVDQHVTHGEILRHADDGVIDGLVAVGWYLPMTSRRYAPTSCRRDSSRCSVRASRRARAGGGLRPSAHREAPGLRSRSSRNQGNCGASSSSDTGSVSLAKESIYNDRIVRRNPGRVNGKFYHSIQVAVPRQPGHHPARPASGKARGMPGRPPPGLLPKPTWKTGGAPKSPYPAPMRLSRKPKPPNALKIVSSTQETQ